MFGIPSDDLTPGEARSLFNILTHNETYKEVESFKFAETISESGFPFTEPDGNHAASSSVPLLNPLFRRWILTYPGITNLPPEFWSGKVQDLVEKLAAAELSESYDKGALGIRKTVATAYCAVSESLVRGVLGGYSRQESRDDALNPRAVYDRTRSEDLARAWDDCIHAVVHSSLMDDMINFLDKEENIEDRSPAVQAAVDYAIIHIATFLHHICIVAAKGPTIVRLIENVHKLMPYMMIRQTLRMTNAATVIGALTKLLLAKIPFSNGGMNLMQRIISLALSWDSAEFKKAAEKIEKDKNGPSKAHLAAIQQYLQISRREHERIREESITKQTSIVTTILDFANQASNATLSELTESQRTQCQQYLAAQLSIRDRDEITSVLCKQTPDLFTQAVRDLVAAFEPMIRAVHDKVNLSEHIAAAENLLDDFIKISTGNGSTIPTADSKGSPPTRTPPSVEDYVRLLRRHRAALYRYWSNVISACPEVVAPFRAWLRDAATAFHAPTPVPASAAVPNTATSDPPQGAAGAMTESLGELFRNLDAETRVKVTAALDAHGTYLALLEDHSLRRMQAILDNMSTAQAARVATRDSARVERAPSRSVSTPSSDEEEPARPRSTRGPGVYLARWQALMDETLITPGMDEGSLRHVRDAKAGVPLGNVVDRAAWPREAASSVTGQDDGNGNVPTAPDVGVVLRAMEVPFKATIAARRH